MIHLTKWTLLLHIIFPNNFVSGSRSDQVNNLHINNIYFIERRSTRLKKTKFHETFFLYKSSLKECQKELDQDVTLITFDPFVSDEDARSLSAYSEMDLIPLLEKVHGKFYKIVVQLCDNLDFPSCMNSDATRFNIPVAAATYNKRINVSSSTHPIQVWLSEDMSPHVFGFSEPGPFNTEDNFVARMESIIHLASKANQIFPGTVPAIILDYSRLRLSVSGSETVIQQVPVVRDLIGKAQKYFQYKLVLVLGVREGKKRNDLGFSPANMDTLPDIFTAAEPDIAVIKMFPEGKDFSVTTVSETFNTFTKRITDLRGMLEKESNLTFPLMLQTTWPDTDFSGNRSYHNLVRFWNGISSWAKSHGTGVILDGAFDMPYREGTLYQTTGWWRLVPNGSYQSPSDFIFDEKCHLASGEEEGIVINSRDNLSLVHLKEDLNFSQEHFGLYFNPLEVMLTDHRNANYNFTSLTSLMKLVTRRFLKLVAKGGYEGDTVSKICAVTRTVAFENHDRAKNYLAPIELIITFDGGSLFIDDWSYSLKISKMCADEANTIHNDTVTAFVISGIYFTIATPEGWTRDMKDQDQLKLGAFLDIFLCSGPLNGTNFQKQVAPLFYPPWNLTTIWFRHAVSKAMTRLGSERILPRVAALFESCKRKVEKVTPQVNLAFITSWPDKDDNEVGNYAELVNYWEGINTWAEGSNMTVILESAFDEFYENEVDGDGWTGGWWKLIPNTSYETVNDFKFEEKKTLARRILAYEDGDTGRDSKHSVFLTEGFYVFGSVGLTILLCSVLVTSFVFYSRRSRTMRQLISKFFEGDQDSNNPYEMKPYQKQTWEFEKGDFFVDKSKFLGSGEFGMVYGGWVVDHGQNGLEETQIAIAVKICKGCDAALEALLSEIKIMAHLGNHENIVSLVGANTGEIEKGKVFAFVEFCELGSLLDYLRKEDPTRPHSQSDLSRWSIQIASGMEYLSEMKVVHIDLATRNVLLTSNKTAKITDFGLSRQLSKYSVYEKKTVQKLPWRWLAPESLLQMQFNEKSDVWAFGVTLWEIYSSGNIPFPRDTWNDEFIQRLEDGERLTKPERCSECIFTIMMRCWEWSSELRPTFTQVKDDLASSFGEYSAP